MLTKYILLSNNKYDLKTLIDNLTKNKSDYSILKSKIYQIDNGDIALLFVSCIDNENNLVNTIILSFYNNIIENFEETNYLDINRTNILGDINYNDFDKNNKINNPLNYKGDVIKNSQIFAKIGKKMFNFSNKKSKLFNAGNNSKLYENLYNKRSHANDITNNTNNFKLYGWDISSQNLDISINKRQYYYDINDGWNDYMLNKDTRHNILLSYFKINGNDTSYHEFFNRSYNAPLINDNSMIIYSNNIPYKFYGKGNYGDRYNIDISLSNVNDWGDKS